MELGPAHIHGYIITVFFFFPWTEPVRSGYIQIWLKYNKTKPQKSKETGPNQIPNLKDQITHDHQIVDINI